jgi:hypothetical protein
LSKISGAGGYIVVKILTGDKEHLQPVYTFSGFVVDDEWIEISLKRRTRFVEVLTLSGPCWVAWRCVKIYAEHV